MKPVNVRPDTYINFDNHNDTRKPIFKAGETEIFLQRLSTKLNKVFVIKKVKDTSPWTYVMEDLKDEEIVRTFYKKKLQKTKQNIFRIEKILEKKANKLYFTWKGYDNSFNSQNDKSDILQNMTQFFPKPLVIFF